MIMSHKSYSELIHFQTFKERFDYLKLKGIVGDATFGFDRHLNQEFYHSSKWRETRDEVIIRDNGCDLGVDGFAIHDRIYIHHIDPITLDQVRSDDICLYDLDNLISCSYTTHLAIHYGDASLLPKLPVDRKPNDTIPWR